MYQIDISDNQDCLQLDADYLTEVVRKTLEAEQVATASLSIAIVDNPTIHELNREYLQHDYETDVLSFLLEVTDNSQHQPGQPRGAGKNIDGEVIVSAEYARDRSADYDWEPLHELLLYIVHGVLHLCGYDDLSEEELPLMRERELAVFSLLNLPAPTRDDDDVGHVDDPEFDAAREQLDQSTGELS
ncbi:MAG: rRNA maturation RNase YbeY [Planctomycetota bacterium]|jgi:probable rRNA maturation factor